MISSFFLWVECYQFISYFILGPCSRGRVLTTGSPEKSLYLIFFLKERGNVCLLMRGEVMLAVREAVCILEGDTTQEVCGVFHWVEVGSSGSRDHKQLLNLVLSFPVTKQDSSVRGHRVTANSSTAVRQGHFNADTQCVSTNGYYYGM